MTAPDQIDRELDAYLMDGPTELPERSFFAVRDRIEATHQRVVIGPWRTPDIMSRLVPIGLGAAAVIAAFVIGIQLLGPTAPQGVGGPASADPSPSPSSTPVGGTVEYQADGASASTVVDAVADGTTVSGTAVTTMASGIHTVGLECAAQAGDTWAFAGTTERTTIASEQAGDWSAVVVRGSSPQHIGIWLSDDKPEGDTCDAWLESIDLDDIDAENFQPVESGELIPPPDLAP